MDYSAEGILERMKSDIQNDVSKIEGSFTMDNLQAVSEELARYYSVILEPLKEEIAERKDDIYTSGNERHYVIWAKEVTDENGTLVVGNARAVGIRDGTGLVQVAIISTAADQPQDEVVQLVAEYIETKRPVGASVTVVAAQGIDVVIRGGVEIKDGFDIATITAAARTNIQAYFSEIAFSRKATALNYHRIGMIIGAIAGVAEVDYYTINGLEESIPADYDEFFTLEELNLNVVI